MLFTIETQLDARQSQDLLVLPFWQRQKKPHPASVLSESLRKLVATPLLSGDFLGKEGESLLLYPQKEKEKRVFLFGLGKEESLSIEKVRINYAELVKECLKRSYFTLNIVIPSVAELRGITAEEFVQAVVEGILLANYRWSYAQVAEEKADLLKKVVLIGILPKMLNVVQKAEEIAEGVYFARDLVNGNADSVTPEYLAEAARNIAKKFGNTKVQIHDRKWIEKEKMGLFAAVARGSAVEPAFIILSYTGNARSKDHTVLIGKGVTFDTGGLNLKPTGSMETMRDDMAGAATVLGTLATVASLKLPINVTAVVAATENAIDAKSYKPGDVYTSYCGATVEIGNTDAEGRLTLADAISYSVSQLKPSRIIDLATLTGSIVIALGEDMAGLFCNDEKLAGQILSASEKTSEIVWRMPLYAPYKEKLKSDIADMNNIGGKGGGSIVAALFLERFAENVPWAHLDIAGPAFAKKGRGYTPKNGVGFGVRLLIDFFLNLK